MHVWVYDGPEAGHPCITCTVRDNGVSKPVAPKTRGGVMRSSFVQVVCRSCGVPFRTRVRGGSTRCPRCRTQRYVRVGQVWEGPTDTVPSGRALAEAAARSRAPVEVGCPECGWVWSSLARERSTIRCPQCRHPTKAPARRAPVKAPERVRSRPVVARPGPVRKVRPGTAETVTQAVGALLGQTPAGRGYRALAPALARRDPVPVLRAPAPAWRPPAPARQAPGSGASAREVRQALRPLVEAVPEATGHVFDALGLPRPVWQRGAVCRAVDTLVGRPCQSGWRFLVDLQRGATLAVCSAHAQQIVQVAGLHGRGCEVHPLGSAGEAEAGWLPPQNRRGTWHV